LQTLFYLFLIDSGFMLFILNRHDSIANQFLVELRDAVLQQDRMRFRKNMERIGQIMAYEISKTLTYKSVETVTPLGKISTDVPQKSPVLITILRAGLPFFQGFVDFFDKADCGFIGAYRLEGEDHVTIKLDYVATTGLEDKIVLLIDPMLATGRSILDSFRALEKHGKPAHVHIVSLVAAPEGIAYLQEHFPGPCSLWTCAVDQKLNHQFYIVPGLGDAGDLSFGTKI
jgi:uracil phosphoribosyltransferase